MASVRVLVQVCLQALGHLLLFLPGQKGVVRGAKLDDVAHIPSDEFPWPRAAEVPALPLILISQVGGVRPHQDDGEYFAGLGVPHGGGRPRAVADDHSLLVALKLLLHEGKPDGLSCRHWIRHVLQLAAHAGDLEQWAMGMKHQKQTNK